MNDTKPKISIIFAMLNGEKFSLVGLKGQGLFTPKDFGITPYFTCTACWRGYVMEYHFIDDQLILAGIKVNVNDPPKINDVEPQKGDNLFKYHYNNLELKTNFTGSNPVALNFSFSITKLITNFCYFYNIPFSQIVILITVTCIVGSLSFVIFLIRRFEKESIIYGFALGIVIMLLAYYDSWDHHLLNLTPILIILIFNLPRQSKITNSIKPSLIFLSFFDLAFVGIWYLIFPLFPFNFEATFFLLLSLYAILKYCLKKPKDILEEDEK